MNWLRKLFGRRKSDSSRTVGGSYQSKCAICGKPLSRQSGFLVMQGQEAMDYMTQRPFRCSNCGIDVCSKCSYEAAVKLGFNTLVCPQCGGRVE